MTNGTETTKKATNVVIGRLDPWLTMYDKDIKVGAPLWTDSVFQRRDDGYFHLVFNGPKVMVKRFETFEKGIKVIETEDSTYILGVGLFTDFPYGLVEDEPVEGKELKVAEVHKNDYYVRTEVNERMVTPVKVYSEFAKDGVYLFRTADNRFFLSYKKEAYL